jgi:CheY-like chemotaxis protein
VRILVVDDELDARMLVQRLLIECDAIVRIAGSAEEAMELIAAEVPEVIVSDIGMPGEDGYSLIRRVRALPPEKGGLTPALRSPPTRARKIGCAQCLPDSRCTSRSRWNEPSY